MKKLFFLFAFMGVFTFAATAQTKACCASKDASAKACSKTMDSAASADDSIVKQVSNEGEVSYVRKEVCPATGKVTMTAVEYCTKTNKFVNVSPTETDKANCTKSATATKVSSTSKKACCAKGNKAGCTKNASTEKVETGAKVKLVSSTEEN